MWPGVRKHRRTRCHNLLPGKFNSEAAPVYIENGILIFSQPGTYKVCRPIIQLYYTQFIGSYLNQNQFFRQIRNLKFDLREMPPSTADNDQPLVPAGIHWQVSQACSLQNLLFQMPDAKDNEKATHVGIFMENGSGGFVSDPTFRGGSIGWRAGELAQFSPSFSRVFAFAHLPPWY